MINTTKRLETQVGNELSENIAQVTVVTYKSFLDGDFKTYYRINDGRDMPREYAVSDCVETLVEADAEHDRVCIKMQEALEKVDYSKVEELWDFVQELRNAYHRGK